MMVGKIKLGGNIITNDKETNKNTDFLNKSPYEYISKI